MPSIPTGTTSVSFVYTTGQTLNAFPIGSSLATWATNKVLFAESAAPNLGKYTTSIPNTLGAEWYIFASAAQPADWTTQIGSIDINESPDVYADTLLSRDMSVVVEGGVRSPLQALRIMRNRVIRTSVSSATGIIVYKEDDATVSWNSTTVVPTSTTYPITESNPN